MPSTGTSRRRFLSVCSALGFGNTLLPGALFTLAAQTQTQIQESTPDFPKITPEMIDAASAIAGITLTTDQKKMMLSGLTETRDYLRSIRDLHLPNSVPPAFIFDPVPGGTVLDTTHKPAILGPTPGISVDASNSEALAFSTVRELGELIRTRKVTSLELTKLYLSRLRKYDPILRFVITYTEDRALKQASAMDAETAAGKSRGPLHGIPWGAKDLLAVRGYPTTWGAGGFESQIIDADATVVQRLDTAGAVLIAKTTLGSLAMGDLWFGARTRNPWNPRQGSSGSSAGSASATAAGCLGFSIGTETLGSISSPSTRCGTSGLRPSFGLVPRTGAMALSWTMDKIGPICRSVEDCALVLSAIYGPDGHDLSVQPAAFNWDATLDLKSLRVGYIKTAFDMEPLKPEAKPEEKLAYECQRYDAKYANATLDVLRSMGFTLMPVEIPHHPYGSIVPILEAEAAAAFDELTRSGRDRLLTGQKDFDWPNTFRVARFYSAVDYIQAMRARTIAIARMHDLFKDFDVIVTPSGGTQLVATNLTGQPAIIVPNGIRGNDAPPASHNEDEDDDNAGGPGTPTSITFLGPLYSEARLAAFAHAYQQKTDFHKIHPKLA